MQDLAIYKKCLEYIPCANLTRDEWIAVCAALKEENCPYEWFDAWSQNDDRYQGTEDTGKVWNSFKGTGSRTITGATLVKMARDYGYEPFGAGADRTFLDWDDDITADEKPAVTAPSPHQNTSLKPLGRPPFQIVDYLEALFRPDDFVNIITYVVPDKEGKKRPAGAGLYSQTVSDLSEEIRENADDPDFFSSVFGSYDSEAGAWIRVNPISGKLSDGAKAFTDRNITRFENCVIECDELPVSEQIERIKSLKLPYKALVYSGGKSVHAIVRIDAKSIGDFKNRFEWLEKYCAENGLPIDKSCSNPSRMTRIPGVMRGQQKQSLLDIGHPESFDEFKKKAIAEKEAMSLEIETLADVIDNPPELKPIQIEGILRRGHKMLLSSGSKAGKSFLLCSLALALAGGHKWLGRQVAQGRVLILNLEIDRTSFIDRLLKVSEMNGWKWTKETSRNFAMVNMRGKAEPLDKLAPKLIARLQKEHFDMVIIDPIYKVITGDENSASDMAYFCNLFDQISAEGDCSVVYCHHHSKGSQAAKVAIDRSSGSGVFARDPDAIIDLTEIGFSDLDRAEFKARLRELVSDKWLKKSGQWDNLKKVHPIWLQDRVRKEELVKDPLKDDEIEEFEDELNRAELMGSDPCFRLSATLREFRSPEPENIIFHYPGHFTDPTGYLESLFLVGDNSPQKLQDRKKQADQRRTDEKREWYDEQRAKGRMLSITDFKDHFKCSVNTIRSWANKQEDLKRENGFILYKNEAAPEQRQKGFAKSSDQEMGVRNGGQNRPIPVIDPQKLTGSIDVLTPKNYRKR